MGRNYLGIGVSRAVKSCLGQADTTWFSIDASNVRERVPSRAIILSTFIDTPNAPGCEERGSFLAATTISCSVRGAERAAYSDGVNRGRKGCSRVKA